MSDFRFECEGYTVSPNGKSKNVQERKFGNTQVVSLCLGTGNREGYKIGTDPECDFYVENNEGGNRGKNTYGVLILENKGAGETKAKINKGGGMKELGEGDTVEFLEGNVKMIAESV